MEVLHQYHGERNDLIIERGKIAEYEKNIDYFLEKHPNALKTNRKTAYKFLKGELPTGMLMFGMPSKSIELNFMDKSKLDEIKKKLLYLSANGDLLPILYDHVEDTDLDIWVQELGVTKNTIKYYPMSKQIDTQKMLSFLEEEKKTQRKRIL